jgi:hypothetical protein
MITRYSYKYFSPELFRDHQDILLHDVYHHIQAYLLYPLNCSCKASCPCDGIRANITLTLNVAYYNEAVKKRESPETLQAMRLLLEIPEERFLQEYYGQAYPLWLIHQKVKEQDIPLYESVRHLIWTLLCLDYTYACSLYRAPAVSIKGAIDIILGKMPLKAKGVLQKDPKRQLCGEKAYSQRLKLYKSVCHFIAATDYIDIRQPLSATQIKRFLSISEWIKEKLLSIRTPNVKEVRMFLKEDFLDLPAWIEVDKVDLRLEPFQDKLNELDEKADIAYQKYIEAERAKGKGT